MAALTPMSGTVTHVKNQGFQVDAQPGTWFTLSRFADPQPALPAVGERVRCGLDGKGFVRTIEVGYDPEVPGVPIPPAPPGAPSSAPGVVLQTRLACLAAAAAYLAPRTEAKYTDVLAVAAKFEEWVTR